MYLFLICLFCIVVFNIVKWGKLVGIKFGNFSQNAVFLNLADFKLVIQYMCMYLWVAAVFYLAVFS